MESAPGVGSTFHFTAPMALGPAETVSVVAVEELRGVLVQRRYLPWLNRRLRKHHPLPQFMWIDESSSFLKSRTSSLRR